MVGVENFRLYPPIFQCGFCILGRLSDPIFIDVYIHVSTCKCSSQFQFLEVVHLMLLCMMVFHHMFIYVVGATQLGKVDTQHT